MRPTITRDSLMTLEAYAKERKRLPRAACIAHKQRCAPCTWASTSRCMFEDELTIRYQIQEMLRIEKIFEEAGIQDEIDAYNPLVPDGSNWKATMLIEYPDVERAQARAGAADRRRGPRLRRGRRPRARLRDRRRGPGPRERREDLGGALPALRADAADGRGAQGRRARCGDRRRPPELPGRDRRGAPVTQRRAGRRTSS